MKDIDIVDTHLQILEAADEANRLGLKALEFGDKELAFKLATAAMHLSGAADMLRSKLEFRA
jgi:hypothetical protein